ncbi:hypothetical protein ABFS82_10G095100 [Erythranthe guttata]
MYSANSGDFPRNPLNTHSEISNAPVLDRNSSLLHFSKNPFTRSEFSVAWGPRLAALKQHRAALYLVRQAGPGFGPVGEGEAEELLEVGPIWVFGGDAGLAEGDDLGVGLD